MYRRRHAPSALHPVRDRYNPRMDVSHLLDALNPAQRACAMCDFVMAKPDPVDPDELAALNKSKADAALLKAHCESLGA